ncbi:hypothetical protein SKAU_G00408150 [Synaphobranchus kaupii]|uniref:Uncharacterized protein n=1 Tax=Synaphobranchus kaupii TaxID=118154 RepID=A0A9Q1ID22_SYNKA|nr:hypothetical protein SKAU_G00408150 [Synaphobranchus kaupii]
MKKLKRLKPDAIPVLINSKVQTGAGDEMARKKTGRTAAEKRNKMRHEGGVLEDNFTDLSTEPPPAPHLPVTRPVADNLTDRCAISSSPPQPAQIERSALT